MDATDAEYTFGAWLRRRRKALDLTQVELAAQVPCAKGTIRRLESDDLRPSKPLVERLADLLGVPATSRQEFIAFARTGRHGAQFFERVLTPAMPQAETAPTTAPAFASRRHMVPAAAHPLIGRLHAVGVAIELLANADVRLVTMIGPPGVGKTRLALQVAAQVEGRFREGACFVALAPLRDAERVPATIAAAIDLVDSGRPLAQALAERLRSEELLLVLDNFEHVIDAAPVVAALLAAAPALKILCTSRVPLRLAGEHEFVVPPLALPEITQSAPAEELAGNPAVALFLARARAVYPGLATTGDSMRQIAEICRRLDGLPLAIELAANRIKLFAPHALLARLDRRLPFLTGGARDAPARQRTLEAAIAWSYDLLAEMEQRCLARLGVFWGGATLEAAEAVCGADLDVVAALQALVDHSLVQSEHHAHEETRFATLETIREFALARLQESGEMEAMQERHARFFLMLAVASERGLQGREQVRWMERLRAENNNLRAAFAWSLAAGGDAMLGVEAAAALWWFWWTNGQVGEGRQWFDALLQRATDLGLTQTRSYGRALLGAGILAFFAGDFAAAMPHLVQARDLGALMGDAITHGYAIFMIGTVMILSEQRDEGHAVLDEGYRILYATGAPATWHLGVTSLARALLSFERRDFAAAQRYADTGMAIFRELGQPYGIGLAFNYQGDVARVRGDHALAADRYRAALPLLREAQARSEIPAVLHNLGHALILQGDVADARALFAEGLELHREVGNRMGMIECLIGLALALGSSGRPLDAARLLGAVDTQLAGLNVPLFAAEQASYEAAAAARTQTDAEAWDAALRAGRTMGFADVLEYVGGNRSGSDAAAS
jgi:predicted ATPase/transcriptional regulator with XRE-family HTH domain